jgi:methylmalonyl-CoA mutase N-terminal domain/subunit
VAIAIANGKEYIRRALSRGVPIDGFAHSIYMFLSAGLEIFEEAAKFRAARRIWSALMVDEFGANEAASRALNIFCYTLGSSQTAQEPLANVVRIAYQSLAAALGGVQTLATSSFDEALQIPSPDAALLGLRTQQVLAYETGMTRTVDPLGGSFYVEALTDELERSIRAYLRRIEDAGGPVSAIESGFLEREIEDASAAHQQRVETGEHVVVGLNRFAATPDQPDLRFVSATGENANPATEQEQLERLAQVRARRSQIDTDAALSELARAAASKENTVEPIIGAVRAEATIGEIAAALTSVWGRHADRS